jgi:hypothetical protein
MWWSEEGERNKLTVTLAQWLSAWLADRNRNILTAPDVTVADDESWRYPDDYWTDDPTSSSTTVTARARAGPLRCSG